MAKSKEVTKVGMDSPGWLIEAAQEADTSLQQVRKYRQLTRARIIQALSKPPELKKEFGEGAVLLQPGRTLVAAADQEFQFVPLFMFTEYVKWSDRDDDASPAVMDRTFDESDDVAKKAIDPARRKEPYGDGYKARYVEHLCFPGVIYGDHPLAMTPVTISFERGEHFNGQGFCSAILLRKVPGSVATAPLWSQVWNLRSAEHSNSKYTWWGFDYSTPENPFIEEEEAPNFKMLADQLAQEFADRALVVDRADADDDAEIVVDDGEM